MLLDIRAFVSSTRCQAGKPSGVGTLTVADPDVESAHSVSKGPESHALPRSVVLALQQSAAGTHIECATELKQELEVPEVSPEVVEQRSRTLSRIDGIIRSKFGHRYRVKMFGSILYGADTPESDLDLVVLDHQRPRGFDPADKPRKLPSVYNVRILGRILRRNGYSNVEIRPTATVPIVKFTDTKTGLQCDLNVNDRLGMINTAMIRRYCALAPHLRPVLVTLKKWAKAMKLNNPAEASFSSYALANMTIAMFQTFGLLPNLQKGFTTLDPKWVMYTRTKSGQAIACDPRFRRLKFWPAQTQVTAKEALKRWFRYWGYRHDYDHSIVAIRHGRLLQRTRPRVTPPSPSTTGSMEAIIKTNHNQIAVSPATASVATDVAAGTCHVDNFGISDDVWDVYESWTSPLCVVDPFIITKNLTGNVSRDNILTFIHRCRVAENKINRGYRIEDLLDDRQDEKLDPWVLFQSPDAPIVPWNTTPMLLPSAEGDSVTSRRNQSECLTQLNEILSKPRFPAP